MNTVTSALSIEVAQTHPMALKGSFTCAAGELLALVGPSGAGKTSMLRVLAGLLRPTTAKITVQGELWCDTAQQIFLPAQRRHVGLVFQNYALMPHLSALNNVALSLLHLTQFECKRQAGHWLEHVGLDAVFHERHPDSLSGGQQQRVAIARALARQPKLLLLDEPFSAVDQMSRQALYRLLAELRQTLSIPIVLVTHDLNEARLLADRLVVMDGGEILQQGSPAQIHRSPRNARVADLVGIHNRLHGQWLGPSAVEGYGQLRWLSKKGHQTDSPVLRVRDKGKIPLNQKVTWVIPNDGITLHGNTASDDHCYAAIVTEARYLGEITLVTLKLPAVANENLLLTLSDAQRDNMYEGMPINVRINTHLIHVMPLRQAA